MWMEQAFVGNKNILVGRSQSLALQNFYAFFFSDARKSFPLPPFLLCPWKTSSKNKR